ncbi:uncharacterized protein LOC115883472 isoform X2 [Sitophilus oryzae]|nr:uncharacterized protein LOC115883472 isoform X2 [Sitophilus oryzae]
MEVEHDLFEENSSSPEDSDRPDPFPVQISEDEDDDSNYTPKTTKKKVLPDYFGVRNKTLSQILQNEPSQNQKPEQFRDGQNNLLLEKIQSNPLLDGKFYEVAGKVTDANHIQAECKMCLPKRKIIKGSLLITTNFLKHMKNKHPEQNNEYNAYKQKKKRINEGKKRNYAEGIESASSSSTTVSLSKSKVPLKQGQISFRQTKITQKTFDERIVRFIVETMSPISLVSHESFVRIFEGMDVKVMNRFAAIQKIDGHYKEMINKIIGQLSICNYVCTTADIWSSKKRSFLGVTCHWIDQDLSRQSVALACRRFEGTHSFDKIGELLDEIHRGYNLDNTKILATVTDNGSNFVKCFKEFGIHILDSQHNVDGNDDQTQEGETEESLPEFESIIESTDSEKSFSQTRQFLPEHLRCASHTINLIATTDYNNSLKSSHQLRSKNCLVFNKCSNLWNKARRPKSAEIMQKILGCSLSYPGVTRWNSTYDAVTKILSLKEKMPELCDALLLPSFTESEILFLTEYTTIMKPLAETLDFLQGEQNTYYGYFLPSIISMHTKLEKIKLSGTIAQLSKSLDYILNSIRERFHHVFTLQSKIAIIAAVTNPRFKMRWLSAFKDTDIQVTAKDIQSWISSSALAFKVSFESDLTAQEELEDAFFDFNDENQVNTSSDAAIKLQSTDTFHNQFEFEFLKYLNDKRTTLLMLNEYNIVKQLFIKYNCILPSSAPVERLFSFAEIINAPRRHALSDTNFEKLVLLKSNKHVF